MTIINGVGRICGAALHLTSRFVPSSLSSFTPSLMAKRMFSGRRNSLVPDGFYRPSDLFDDITRRYFDRFDRYLGFGGFRPFIDLEHPTSTEFFRLKNPIVEEDGMKKFKLEFDVRRFRPEDVKITTDSKNNMLIIEAKHVDDDSRFEYLRKISIPEGVKNNELKCIFKGDGVLALEAPYTPPPEKESPKETPIEIEHK